MTQEAAVLVTKVEGAKVTRDGFYMLLKLSVLGNPPTVMAFPYDQLFGLADMAALAIAESAKARKANPYERSPYTVSWWELSRHAMTGQAILSLTFGAGGRLDFLLPDPMPLYMHETLGALLGLPKSPHGIAPVELIGP
jgi:hypothetical protein